MRNVYAEYLQGIISWDEAYFIANNNAATVSSSINTTSEETDYWCRQMESLGIDAAENNMRALGYTQDNSGVFHIPE